MPRFIKYALVLTLLAGSAPLALANSALHIERQCDRYGNFCGSPAVIQRSAPVYKAPKVKKVSKKAKAKSVSKSVAAHPVYKEPAPFIERQCDRYGHFC